MIDKDIFDNSFGLCFIDIHGETCGCSYCKETSAGESLHYGLNIPKDKSGWWVIKYKKGKYLRFTPR